MPIRKATGALSAALAWALCADAAPTSDSHTIEQIVPGSPFHGVHGLTFDRNDVLYAGSVVGQRVYRVDTATGHAEAVVDPPHGMADDLVFLDDGTLVWTAIVQGIVYARKGDEPVREIAKLASINSINVRREDGRLFAGQVFGGDGVWEIDPTGAKPPRSIVSNPGGFNGFDIGADGMLYGPLWFKKQVVRIDPDSGSITVVADGFETPAAANFDSRGNLYVLDTALGHVIRVDIATGAKHVVAKLDTALDNLAIDSKDRIFVSNMADNGIQEVDPETGSARQVVKGELAIPMSIAAIAGAPDTIYVADVFAFRSVDGATGKVTDIARSHAKDSPIHYPVAVSADDAHVMLVSSDGTVQKYDRRKNAFTASWTLQGVLSAHAIGDDVLVVLADGTARRLSGNDTTGKVVASGLGNITGFALGMGNVAYVADAGAGRVSRIDLSSGQSTVVAANLRNPRGLAVTSGNDLLTIEMDARRLVRIAAGSGTHATIATDLPVGGENNPTMTAGIAVGRSDVIYISSDVENSLWRLTPKPAR